MKNPNLSFIAIVISISLWSVVDAEDKKPSSEYDLTGGKVFESLADFNATVESLNMRNHAVVGRGEWLRARERSIDRHEIVWLAVNRGRDTLHARCRIAVNSQNRVLELWSQRMQFRGKTAYRYGLPSRERYQEVESEEDDHETKRDRILRMQFRDVDPLGLAAGLPSSIQIGFPIQRNWLAEALLESELEFAKFNSDGDIEAAWLSPQSEGRPYRKTEITFGKSYGWMPVRCKAVSLFNDDITHQFGESATRYEKYGELFLPSECEVIHPHNGMEDNVILKFRWKIGEKVSASLLNSKSDNWIEPARILFNETWQRKGFVAPVSVDHESGDIK